MSTDRLNTLTHDITNALNWCRLNWSEGLTHWRMSFAQYVSCVLLIDTYYSIIMFRINFDVKEETIIIIFSFTSLLFMNCQISRICHRTRNEKRVASVTTASWPTHVTFVSHETENNCVWMEGKRLPSLPNLASIEWLWSWWWLLDYNMPNHITQYQSFDMIPYPLLLLLLSSFVLTIYARKLDRTRSSLCEFSSRCKFDVKGRNLRFSSPIIIRIK